MSSIEAKGHFLTLYKMVLADDHVDPAEMELLYSIGLEHGINKEDLTEILMNPQLAQAKFPEGTEEKLLLLFNIARMACADGIIADAERSYMQSLCQKFGFEDANIPEITEFVIEQARSGVSSENFLRLVGDYI